MTTRDYMIENDANMGWCKPFGLVGKDVFWTSCEGAITGVKIGDDEFTSVTDNVLHKLAAVVNPDFIKVTFYCKNRNSQQKVTFPTTKGNLPRNKR